MTLKEIREHVMFQTNNDADDLGDYLPYLDRYINDAYDEIIYAWAGSHTNNADPAADYPHLEDEDDEPQVPDWLHTAICDGATWYIYRNGNPQKQSRGYAYRQAFEAALRRIRNEGGLKGESTNYGNFRNHLDP